MSTKNLPTRHLDLSHEAHNKANELLAACSSFPDIQRMLAHMFQQQNDGISENLFDCIAPKCIDIYREYIWNTIGEDNMRNLLTELSFSHCEESHLRLNLIFSILSYYKPSLSRVEKRHVLNSFIREDPIYYFDSYWFFAAGHTPALDRTLEALFYLNPNSLIIIFIDNNLLLFPDLIRAISIKYGKVVFIDVSSNTLALSSFSDRFFAPELCIDEINSVLQATNQPSINVFIGDERCSWLNPQLHLVPNRMGINAKAIQCGSLFSSLWGNLCSKNESLEICNEYISSSLAWFPYSRWIIYHQRNSSFRWKSVRDSPPLTQRLKFVEFLKSLNIGIVVLGIVPPEDKVCSDNVLYLSDQPPSNSSMQLNFINAALALVGSCSGITNFAGASETPLLVIDTPFPNLPIPSKSGSFLLLKNVLKNGSRIDPTIYLNYEGPSFHESDQMSPLISDNFLLDYNNSAQIAGALADLFALVYKRIDAITLFYSIFGSPPLIPRISSEIWLNQEELLKASSSLNYDLVQFKHVSRFNWL